MMRQYIILMVGFGILFIFGCAGSQGDRAGTKIDGKLITPQNLIDF